MTNHTTKPPRSADPAMCEVPGFEEAALLARQIHPEYPAEAWEAAAQSRDAMHRQIIARGGLLRPGHVIDAALKALRLGASDAEPRAKAGAAPVRVPPPHQGTTKPRAPRSPAPTMCEVPGFLHAARLAREAYPSLPRGAWVAAARSRDAMHRQIIAGRGRLLPVHVIDAALKALRLGAVVDTTPARRRSPAQGHETNNPRGAA